MTSQLGVSKAISTPSRLAISVPTSMSKPWYSPSAVSSDCGGYCGSVDILIVPACRTLSSRPPGIGEAGASLAGASLGALRSPRASLAAGGSLASGALELPAATAGARPDRDRGHGQQDDREAAAPPGNCVHVSSMTHRSRPVRRSSCAQGCRSNARAVSQESARRARIGRRATIAACAAAWAPIPRVGQIFTRGRLGRKSAALRGQIPTGGESGTESPARAVPVPIHVSAYAISANVPCRGIWQGTGAAVPISRRGRSSECPPRSPRSAPARRPAEGPRPSRARAATRPGTRTCPPPQRPRRCP